MSSFEQQSATKTETIGCVSLMPAVGVEALRWRVLREQKVGLASKESVQISHQVDVGFTLIFVYFSLAPLTYFLRRN